jgi:hypothetical protein
MRVDAHTRIHREPAVLVSQHLFGIKPLQQAPAYKGAQDATAQSRLRLGHAARINARGWVKNDTLRCDEACTSV